MKIFNKKLFALIALLSMGGSALAYTWGFSNMTNNTLIVEVKLIAHDPRFYKFIKPGQRLEFRWTPGSWLAGYCLDFVRWSKPNQNDPNIQRVDVNGDIDIDYNPYNPFHDVTLAYLPNDLYDKTVQNAAGIGKGFDSFMCGLVPGLKDNCPNVLAKLIEWFGGVLARSACRSREIIILEDDKGEIMFATQLN